MLSHKQKFWLGFQKEHLLEIDANSDEERKRKKKEKIEEKVDFIKALDNKDPKAKKKVDTNLKYFQHENRTTFDQNIIGGLFEEYASDSDEEDKINRVMDTEEEKKEFYSLYLLLDPELRKNQFNKSKKSAVEKLDFQPLRNLYNNHNSITSIGVHEQQDHLAPSHKNKSSLKNS